MQQSCGAHLGDLFRSHLGCLGKAHTQYTYSTGMQLLSPILLMKGVYDRVDRPAMRAGTFGELTSAQHILRLLRNLVQTLALRTFGGNTEGHSHPDSPNAQLTDCSLQLFCNAPRSILFCLGEHDSKFIATDTSTDS